ncbi:MAG: ribosomal protein S12 methylthiotransferase [Cognaticolwellia sp.]|jgi:tRNA A37 methylthiotransferase MiaB
MLYVINLNWPKNLVDSQSILTQLRNEGYDVINSYNDAEFLTFNAFGFID